MDQESTAQGVDYLVNTIKRIGAMRAEKLIIIDSVSRMIAHSFFTMLACEHSSNRTPCNLHASPSEESCPRKITWCWVTAYQGQ